MVTACGGTSQPAEKVDNYEFICGERLAATEVTITKVNAAVAIAEVVIIGFEWSKLHFYLVNAS